jgi:LacI family transcriptional regulator
MLTTVRQPMRELGDQAVQLLFSRLRDPTSSRRGVLLSTHLVVRESRGCRVKDSAA